VLKSERRLIPIAREGRLAFHARTNASAARVSQFTAADPACTSGLNRSFPEQVSLRLEKLTEFESSAGRCPR